MKLSHTASIPAPIERVWAGVMDIPRAAGCVPGVRDVTATADDRYHGVLGVQLGPVRLSLGGEIAVTERDEAAKHASLRADAKDTRLGGSVHATMDLALSEDGPGCVLAIESDVQIAGRIGEFGQPVIQRKADQILREFSACLAKQVAS